MRGVIAQVWTAPKCESGAVALGALPDVVSDSWVESRQSTAAGRLTLRRDAAQSSGLEVGRIVRIVSPARGVLEWVVTQLDDQGGASGGALVSVACSPLRALLGLRGLVRTEAPPARPLIAFTPPSLQIGIAVQTYVLTNLAADGLSWLSLGTVEGGADQPIQLDGFTAWTRGQVLTAIEQKSGLRAVLRPLANDAGYAIDLVVSPNADLPVRRLSLASGAASVTRARDALRAPTVLTPITVANTLLGDTGWRVTAIAGAWITLRDPDALDDVTMGPVLEDGQLVGAWLRNAGGTTSQIVASRAATGEVQVLSATGFAVRDNATLAQDAAGTPLVRLANQRAVEARGLIGGTIRVPTPRTERNLLADPFVEETTTRWATAGTAQAVRWPYTQAPAAGAVNGAVSSGASSVTVDGFPSGYIVRRGQSLNVESTTFDVAAAVVTSSTGTATVSVTPTLPASIADETPIEWRANGVVLAGTGRADGVQSSGGSSLVLSDLPATPAFLVGDTLTVNKGAGFVDTPSTLSERFEAPIATLGAPFASDIPAGREVRLVEVWRATTGLGVLVVPSDRYGTVASPYTAGAATISLSMPGRSVVIGGGSSYQLIQAFLDIANADGQTLTLTSAPAWSTSRQATPSVTPALNRALILGEEIGWRRAGGALVATLTAVSGASGASSLTVEGDPGVVQVIGTADTLVQSGARLYASADTTLTGGAGTIPIDPTAPVGLLDNAPIAAECPVWPSNRVGYQGATLLRRSGSVPNRLASQAFTVPGSGSQSAVIRVDWVVWTPDPTQLVTLTADLRNNLDQLIFRAETANIVLGQPAQVWTTSATGTVAGGASIKLWLYTQGTTDVEFCWVSRAMVTLGSDAQAPFTAGSFNNLAYRTALQQLADATGGARFRLNGSALEATLAAIGTESAPLAIGQRVRLVLPELSVDVPLRVDQLTYSFGEPDRWQADLGGIPPRLASIDVTVG